MFVCGGFMQVWNCLDFKEKKEKEKEKERK